MANPRKQTSSGTIGVIGAGVMGQAIAESLLERKIFSRDNLWAVTLNHDSARAVEKKLGITCLHNSYDGHLKKTDIILLCVKPSQCLNVLPQLRKAGLPKSALVISIVTGVTTTAMQSKLSGNPIVRAITNTPCLVGEGMTALCRGSKATENHLAKARTIFESVGRVIELNESLCDAMTGLSASGPAYIYLVIEALADGGVKVGIPRDLAFKIVSQTVLGAATMVRETGRHPASLRDDVTTPAGCTIGALLTMEDGKIRSTLARAVEEATRIAGQLGKGKKA
jgi:pyrroline-5-carboxylate reductase